jgi:hypothetical protein
MRVVTFADGFVSTTPPDVNGLDQENYTLLNDQAVTNITGLLFDSSEVKSVFFTYELERIGTTTYRQSGQFIAAFNGTWSLTFGNYQGDSIIEDTLTQDYGFVISIDSASGQIKYESGDQAGHTSSKLKLFTLKVVV